MHKSLQYITNITVLREEVLPGEKDLKETVTGIGFYPYQLETIFVAILGRVRLFSCFIS